MLTRAVGVFTMTLVLAFSATAQNAGSSAQLSSGDFKASIASLSLYNSTSPFQGGKGGTTASKTASSSGRGEHTPAFEIALGYVYTSFNPPGPDHNMNGGIGSITGNVNNWLGLTAEFTGSTIGGLPANTDGTFYTYLFGPTFSRRSDRITPFLHSLFGAGHLNVNAPPTVVPGSFLASTLHQNAFAMALGGGFDVNLGRRLSWRIVEADYLLTKFTDGQDNRQNNFRASTALILKFRQGPPPPPPNRPPTVTAVAKPDQVIAGDSAAIEAQASDPDNDPLTYTWSANGGSVDGSGPQVRWNSAGAAPGKYSVTVKVDDGRGGTASSSADVNVVPRPNRPPVVSDCSANPATVTPGQPVSITATASDPDKDPLTYSYSSSGGKVSGAGPRAQFDTTGLAPGNYTVTCLVDDGRGGKAEGHAAIQVQAPAPPPQQKQLETRLSLHSIYFPTAQPTVQNPNGGLLASQQRTLTTLAADFKQYLTFKPDAQLTLQGHADPRGGPDYNKALSERRVERTKSFLVQHGVPAEHIQTQGLGEEQPMSAAQVKQAVDQDPNLTPAQKKQLTANAGVLALAQSRRVDVTLSTTGETSARQFPFNAEDALNLINPKGAGKAAAPAGKKAPAKPGAKKPPAKKTP
jgi:outer membrane protein OmpA-like peptidoglycan-associated protein